MILSQALNQAVIREPSQVAILDLGTTLTFASLRERVGKLSNFYQAELPQGSRVAILAQNGPYFVQTFFALTNTGNPAVLLDSADTDEGLLLDLKNLNVSTILLTGQHVSRMQDLFRRERLEIKIIEVEKRRAGEYDDSFQPLPDRSLKDSDTVLFIRQDDFGGERRYCSFSHAQLIAACNSVKRFYRLTPADRMLTTMSWSHPFALTHGLLLPIFTGATCVVNPETVSVEEFVDFLAEKRVTRFAGPPKFYFQLLNFCAVRKYPLPGVKSITVGMGSISLALRKTYKLLKIPVLRCYGRPEAVWSLAMDAVDDALDVEGARSKPANGVRMVVLTEDGEEIPGPGRREGRLLVTSDTMARGYFHPVKGVAEAKTTENFRGTWLRTDDVARLEGEGDTLTVAVLGKLHDMLLIDGVYHSPRRLDDVAAKLDGVSEAAGFVRIGRDKKPSFAVALVMTAKRANEKDLIEAMQSELPDEYAPKSVHFVSYLPRDAFDSVNRLALSRQFSVT
jgi:acyl-CoA synthetase (AMP-forming)/AMP-acid ligase II